MKSTNWTKEQTKLAFHLYCQIPFGKIHSRNPEVMALAGLIGRTPGAVAMKMSNLASLDPAITSSGRSGLGNASAMDKEVWEEFHSDWEKLALECEQLKAIKSNDKIVEDDSDDSIFIPDDFTGETKKVIIEQRVKQHFFRKAVLSSYSGRCCISGVSDSRLLVASHIIPWSKDKANRLNPSNGLCLSAIHDKAFDKGLISLTDEFRIIISDDLKKQKDDFVLQTFISFENKLIQLPEKFIPEAAFLAYHREHIFVG